MTEPTSNVIYGRFPVIPRKAADRRPKPKPDQYDRCFHCGTRLACLGSGDLTFTCRSCYETLRDAGKLSELKRPGEMEAK